VSCLLVSFKNARLFVCNHRVHKCYVLFKVQLILYCHFKTARFHNGCLQEINYCLFQPVVLLVVSHCNFQMAVSCFQWFFVMYNVFRGSRGLTVELMYKCIHVQMCTNKQVTGLDQCTPTSKIQLIIVLFVIIWKAFLYIYTLLCIIQISNSIRSHWSRIIMKDLVIFVRRKLSSDKWMNRNNWKWQWIWI